MTRLTAEFWVDAYMRRLQLADIPAYLMRRGDATAGAVLVRLDTMDGQARVFQRSFDLMTGERRWVVLAEGPEAEVGQTLARQAERDPDLWIVEIEDRQGRHMLDQPGLDG
ncbi:GTP-binding protein Era [Brevirhabdus pacifica]|uniref:GTP-binding protein Era n=1 Tax=Brevirhabdus pacifica TaxID=1267768 RepID=A0A1U7DJJ6_9RHOB|nr:DUF1491 family protein [Brevirhabdus pacifica]APX90095.1 GTP-binding protein Era [Brevirhabdus pacifica]OWU75315.1 GTP-binding protein Era [Loktanella sp. 22II-4b]PJJ82651.1 hypothetical protein CLV77_2425 [Brevirhabdus pacifica]